MLTILMEIFKMSGPNDSVEVRWENDAVIVNFRCESSEGVQVAVFDVKVGAVWGRAGYCQAALGGVPGVLPCAGRIRRDVAGEG